MDKLTGSSGTITVLSGAVIEDCAAHETSAMPDLLAGGSESG